MPKSINKILIDEIGQVFDLSLLGYRKNNPIINKIKNSPYNDLRRLVMIRLYLCDSLDWEKWVITDDILKWSEVFVQIWKEEINSIINLGVKKKDVIDLINKAYHYYFLDNAIQKSLDLWDNSKKREFQKASKYLTTKMKNRDYLVWEIRWFLYPQELIITMMYLVDECWLVNLINHFKIFLDAITDSNSLISEEKILNFYRNLNNLIIEEYRDSELLISTKEGISKKVVNIVK